MSSSVKRSLDLSRAQWRTLLVVWITYGAFYLCRVNIGPARVEIEKSFSIDPLEMGFVLGALKVGYAIGQLVNGQLAERYGPKRILLVGMFGSVTRMPPLRDGRRRSRPCSDRCSRASRAASPRVVRVVAPQATLGPTAALLLVALVHERLLPGRRVAADREGHGQLVHARRSVAG